MSIKGVIVHYRRLNKCYLLTFMLDKCFTMNWRCHIGNHSVEWHKKIHNSYEILKFEFHYVITLPFLFFGKLIDCGRAKLSTSSPAMIRVNTKNAQWCVNGKPNPIPCLIDQANRAPRRLGENTLKT